MTARVVVVIPAHNEERTIAKVVVRAKRFAAAVIVCDDGSTDMTGDIAAGLGAQVVSHEFNLGKGRALKDLFEAAKKLDPSVVVTIDGDDQHDPSDIPRVAGPVISGSADIVVGVRPMDPASMPRERIMGNKVLDNLTSLSAGEDLHDTQSGFRAYSPGAIDRVSFSQLGMATESQTLIDAVNMGLRIVEVPVSVKYAGIRQKRNPIAHLSHVVDYLITRTVVDSPLLYLGAPGLIAVFLGLLAGIRVLSIFSTSHQIAVGTALVAIILLLMGSITVATSLILKLLTARQQIIR